MLTITESASAYLTQVLEEADMENPADKAVAVRIVMGDRGLGMTLDESRPDDATFDHQGKIVLVIDPVLAQALAEKTLDFETGEQGDALTLQ